MKFKLTFITAAVLCASSATATQLTGFFGAGCTGAKSSTVSVGTGCQTGDSHSVKSIRYSGVPHSIKFFKSGGQNDNCKGTASLTLGSGSRCATAPAGFNWESVRIA